MSVYLTLQKSYGCKGDYDKTIAIQKCGNYPYELTLRFAQCCLRCGACFAAGYSWFDKFRNNKRVRSNIPIEQIIADFQAILNPPFPHINYNWMRILGGEPLLNDRYIEYLLETLIKLSTIDANKFNNGIIIQTNGIHIGKGNTNILKNKLIELYKKNPKVVVVIEISIKGTNPEEFKLISDPEGKLVSGLQRFEFSTRLEEALFKYNIQSYYKLKELELPNLRPTIIAGYGISESFLLTEGRSPKSTMTILFDADTPTYHPSIWSDNFKRLYNDFINDWKEFDNMFSKMPMYGIKDQFNYGWVRLAIGKAKKIYKGRFYDADYVTHRNPSVESKFKDILEKFFLKSNQEYYSTLIRR